MPYAAPVSLQATPAQSRAFPPASSAPRRWARWPRVAQLVMCWLVCSLSGCFKATFVNDPSASQAAHAESFWRHEFVYGLIGSAELDLRDVCAGNQAHIETGGNLLTTAVSLVSAGLYTPRTLFVRCLTPTTSADDDSTAAPSQTSKAAPSTSPPKVGAPSAGAGRAP